MNNSFQNIARAAESYKQGHYDYPLDVGPGQLPPELASLLDPWPSPPCSGWLLDWENWQAVPGAQGTVRITVRRPDLTPAAYYCIESKGNCNPDLYGSGGSNWRLLTASQWRCQ